MTYILRKYMTNLHYLYNGTIVVLNNEKTNMTDFEMIIYNSFYESMSNGFKFERTGDLLSVQIALAGTKKEDVDTYIEDGVLVVKTPHIKARGVYIGDKWKVLGAEYVDGMLTVNFEKKNKRKKLAL